MAAWLAGLGLAAAVNAAHAGLVIDGPSKVLPGETVTFSIGLDAPLQASIDELMVQLDFDPLVLHAQDADAGALLAGTLFLATPEAGTATASFIGTLATLGPGVLATWKFQVDPAAPVSSQTELVAHLQTFIIDSPPTADLSSSAHLVTVVPEPATGAMLGLGVVLLGMLGAGRARRSSR